MQRAGERRRKRLMVQRQIRRAMTFGCCVLALWASVEGASLVLHRFAAADQTDGAAEEEAKEAAVGLPKGADTLSESDKAKILLVNKEHPLDGAYQPELKKLHDYGVEVDTSIYKALQNMLAAGEQQGLSFWVASGYRSLERQRELLDEDIGELIHKGYSYSEAYEEVIRETMPVGCSEHATGLSVDIVAKDYQILDAKQADTAEIKWLQENCSQYGFILRYPKGKEDITKVFYESWHFRYVGIEAAKEIADQGLTLEEYLDTDSIGKS